MAQPWRGYMLWSICSYSLHSTIHVAQVLLTAVLLNE